MCKDSRGLRNEKKPNDKVDGGGLIPPSAWLGIPICSNSTAILSFKNIFISD